MSIADLPLRADYAVLGHQVAVTSNSAAFIDTLDRLNVEFQSPASAEPRALYEAVDLHAGRVWELNYQGQELRWCDSLLEAVGHLEWHIVNEAISWRPDLLHLHGAALAGPTRGLLLPGSSGIGKTTFALALTLRGLRLYADDVVFLRVPDGRPVPFPRSPHVHHDALRRLTPLGLRYAPEEHLGQYLCATALRPWPTEPGPPLGAVLFLERAAAGPPRLAPLTQAEAAVRLIRVSHTLSRRPRHGLNLLPGLLANAACHVLFLTDDLAAAADLVYHLVTG